MHITVTEPYRIESKPPIDGAPSMHMPAFCSTNLAIKPCFTRSAPSFACRGGALFLRGHGRADVQSSGTACIWPALATLTSHPRNEGRVSRSVRLVWGRAGNRPDRPRHGWKRARAVAVSSAAGSGVNFLPVACRAHAVTQRSFQRIIIITSCLKTYTSQRDMLVLIASL